MNFGKAVEALKQGKKVARKGWNGKGMYIFLHEGYSTNENRHITGNKSDYCPPHICMKTAQETVLVGWLASQTDMLSEDWAIVD